MALKRAICIMLLAAALSGCSKNMDNGYDTGKQYSRVLTTVYLGYNNLSSYMEENIDSVQYNPLPVKQDSRVLLSYEHLNDSEPVLTRVYSDWSGRCCRDTLLTFPANTTSTDADFLSDLFNYIKDSFPSDHYGLLISSHGTGWLPEGYYEKGGITTMAFGSEYDHEDKEKHIEISLEELESCLTMQTDYLILDACLMGGVETAYQLRNKTDKLVFCATEMMAVGFPYELLVQYLLKEDSIDLEGYCKAFYNKLLTKSSCGTVAVINTAEMEGLAQTCAPLFEKYRSELSLLKQNQVQGFYRFNKKWFFDLRDMLVQAGISSEEKTVLDEALSKCVSYKANTDYFLGIELETYCGLSTYMPGEGNEYLDNYYKGLDWNKATLLVK